MDTHGYLSPEQRQAILGDAATRAAVAEESRKALLEATRGFLERVDVKALDEMRKSFELPPEALGALIEIHAKKLAESERPFGEMHAGREVLPMSSGKQRIRPGQSATITARPQRVAFRPERVFISGFAEANKGPWWKRISPWYRPAQGIGAADWLVNDIRIGHRSQFSQAGDIPGDIFAATAIDSFVLFETVRTAMDVEITVTYIGPCHRGLPFYGAMIGTVAA